MASEDDIAICDLEIKTYEDHPAAVSWHHPDFLGMRIHYNAYSVDFAIVGWLPYQKYFSGSDIQRHKSLQEALSIINRIVNQMKEKAE